MASTQLLEQVKKQSTDQAIIALIQDNKGVFTIPKPIDSIDTTIAEAKSKLGTKDEGIYVDAFQSTYEIILRNLAYRSGIYSDKLRWLSSKVYSPILMENLSRLSKSYAAQIELVKQYTKSRLNTNGISAYLSKFYCFGTEK